MNRTIASIRRAWAASWRFCSPVATREASSAGMRYQRETNASRTANPAMNASVAQTIRPDRRQGGRAVAREITAEIVRRVQQSGASPLYVGARVDRVLGLQLLHGGLVLVVQFLGNNDLRHDELVAFFFAAEDPSGFDAEL